MRFHLGRLQPCLQIVDQMEVPDNGKCSSLYQYRIWYGHEKANTGYCGFELFVILNSGLV
jgi:hypothetical protein